MSLRPEVRTLVREQLLQHNELQPASEIGRPLNIPLELLQYWHTAAREICRNKEFCALAFTQLSEKVRQSLGFSDTLPPRVIFLTRYQNDNGILIVNPRIEIAEDTRYIPKLEGCGSIAHSRLHYFIERPISKTVYGFIFDGVRSSFASYKPEMTTYDASVHEEAHLNGKTALNYPSDIIDFRNPQQLLRVINHTKRMLLYETADPIRDFRRMLQRISPEGYLVFDKPTNRFIRVGAYGEFLGAFG